MNNTLELETPRHRASYGLGISLLGFLLVEFYRIPYTSAEILADDNGSAVKRREDEVRGR